MKNFDLVPAIIVMLFLLRPGQLFAEDEDSYRFPNTTRELQFSNLENALEQRFSTLNDVSISSIRRSYMDFLAYIAWLIPRNSYQYLVDFTTTVNNQTEYFSCDISINANKSNPDYKFFVHSCESDNDNIELADFFVSTKALDIEFTQ